MSSTWWGARAPTPGEGQVRLSVRAASVNPIDWKLRRGAMARSDAPAKPGRVSGKLVLRV